MVFNYHFSNMQSVSDSPLRTPTNTPFQSSIPSIPTNLYSSPIGSAFGQNITLSSTTKPILKDSEEPHPGNASSSDSIDSPLFIPNVQSGANKFLEDMSKVTEQKALLSHSKLNIETLAKFIPEEIPSEQREGLKAYISPHPLKAFALGYFDKLVRLKSQRIDELRTYATKNSMDWVAKSNLLGQYEGLVKEYPQAIRTLFIDFLDLIHENTVATIFGKYDFIDLVVSVVLLDLQKTESVPNYKTKDWEFDSSVKYFKNLETKLKFAFHVSGKTMRIWVDNLYWFRIVYDSGRFLTYDECMPLKTLEPKGKGTCQPVNHRTNEPSGLQVIGKKITR